MDDRERAHGKSDHLFHSILKYGLPREDKRTRSRSAVKIEPFFAQPLRSTRLETYDSSGRGERHRYDSDVHTCSKIHDRMPDIPRAPVGNTPQKTGTPNGIDRKSLRRIANVEYFISQGDRL